MYCEAAADFKAGEHTTEPGLVEELENARHGPLIAMRDTEGSDATSCSDDDCSVPSAFADDEVAHALVGQRRGVPVIEVTELILRCIEQFEDEMQRTLMSDVMYCAAASDARAWKGTTDPYCVPRDVASDFEAHRDTEMAGLGAREGTAWATYHQCGHRRV